MDNNNNNNNHDNDDNNNNNNNNNNNKRWLLLDKKLETIIFNQFRFFGFLNFDFLINFKPKPRSHSPMAKKSFFLT